MEQWKAIPGFESFYQVSSLGRVRSFDREVIRKNGVIEKKKSRILKHANNGNGYQCVQLVGEGTSTRKYIHRIVMEAFHGPSNMVVDHIDHNKSNNCLDNLQYLTPRGNTSKSKRKSTTTSRYVGVHQCCRSGNWFATIRIQGAKFFLGTHKTQEDAHEAYQKALSAWEDTGINPKGVRVENHTEHRLFGSKTKGHKSKSAKIVLCRLSGIFYDSAKEAAKALNHDYKYLSSMLTGKRPNTTTLKYC